MKIDIIGRGHVASHLLEALNGRTDATIVNSRTLDGLRKDCDLYLISVSDDAIIEVASKAAELIPGESVLAHTSGTTPMSVLDNMHEHIGVFYPLQTFTKGVKLKYSEIPFFLEGSDKLTETVLEKTVTLIGAHSRFIDSSQRRELHIASVFSCNFINHLWCLADSYLRENGLDFSDLIPLIKETTAKIERVKPYEAQTGPAVRQDMKTINSHMDKLEQYPGLKEIYSLLTKSIIDLHKRDNKLIP